MNLLLVRGDLVKLQRKTLSAMITLDVHGRDVVRLLIRKKLDSINNFEWTLVTEMSVSGVVVPNAQFHTYQILPYTSYLWLQFLGECLIYAFFSSHIYSWYQEHVNLNLYRSSNLFMAIKNRYVKVVPKWFYLWGF